MSESDDRKPPKPSPAPAPSIVRQSDSAAPGKPDASPSPIPGEPGYDPEACLDAVLKAEGLNRYGDPQGLMYAGGSPLFDERTGERLSRREYVGLRRPDLLERCPEIDESK